ncbi:MAG TPA: hypothetical protein EYP41_00705 [Anaerolineae bacterium]|nr:hypothetical protein [Anaerolineae bacterium]
MTPIVNGLEEEFDAEITVVRLNAAEPENVELQQGFGLRGHPAFAILDENGRTTETFFGPQSEETLRAALTAVVLAEN